MEKQPLTTVQPTVTVIVGQHMLTMCQARIVSLSALGLQRKTIAHHLGNSRHTIDTHLDRIYKLLGINDGRQLVAWALANGFDLNGNLQETYLFHEYEDMPFEPTDKPDQ